VETKVGDPRTTGRQGRACARSALTTDVPAVTAGVVPAPAAPAHRAGPAARGHRRAAAGTANPLRPRPTCAYHRSGMHVPAGVEVAGVRRAGGSLQEIGMRLAFTGPFPDRPYCFGWLTGDHGPLFPDTRRLVGGWYSSHGGPRPCTREPDSSSREAVQRVQCSEPPLQPGRCVREAPACATVRFRARGEWTPHPATHAIRAPHENPRAVDYEVFTQSISQSAKPLRREPNDGFRNPHALWCEGCATKDSMRILGRRRAPASTAVLTANEAGQSGRDRLPGPGGVVLSLGGRAERPQLISRRSAAGGGR